MNERMRERPMVGYQNTSWYTLDAKGGPHHQRRVEQQAFEWTKEASADHLIAPDHKRTPSLETEVLVAHIVANQLNVPRIRDSQPPLVRHAEKWN